MKTDAAAFQRGDYPGAEESYSKALREAEVFGDADVRVAETLGDLAAVLRLQGRYADAEPRVKRSLQIREQAYGPHYPLVAASLNNLALVYRAQGCNADASSLFRRALEIREAALGQNHPDVGQVLNNLALLLRDEGRI